MAAAGIRQNIATRAAMIQNAQRAGLNTGMKAAEQAGSALTSRTNIGDMTEKEQCKAAKTERP